jgi:hypothetical protein
MADNAVTIGGSPVASDDIGGVQYQRVKIAHGANNSAVDASDVDPFPVRGNKVFVQITLSLPTAAMSADRVMADTQAITNAMRAANATGTLLSVSVIDRDDQGVPFDILFLSANVSLGTENAAPSISDANAGNYLGRVQIAAGDYIDLGGVRVADRAALGIGLRPASGTRDVYFATITRGAPTYTASGVDIVFCIDQD